METYNRKTKFTELKPYCHMANENDFVEVTEWKNGEGFDVSISDKKTISLTWGEWECIQALAMFKG